MKNYILANPLLTEQDEPLDPADFGGKLIPILNLSQMSDEEFMEAYSEYKYNKFKSSAINLYKKGLEKTKEAFDIKDIPEGLRIDSGWQADKELEKQLDAEFKRRGEKIEKDAKILLNKKMDEWRGEFQNWKDERAKGPWFEEIMKNLEMLKFPEETREMLKNMARQRRGDKTLSTLSPEELKIKSELEDKERRGLLTDEERKDLEQLQAKEEKLAYDPATAGVLKTTLSALSAITDDEEYVGSEFDKLVGRKSKEVQRDGDRITVLEPKADAAMRVAFNGVADAILGVGPDEILDFYNLAQEGEYFKAYQKIEPNVSPVVNEVMDLIYTNYFQEEEKDETTGERKPKKLKPDEVKSKERVVATMTMTSVMLISVPIAMYRIKQRSVSRIIELARDAKLTEKQFLKVAEKSIPQGLLARIFGYSPKDWENAIKARASKQGFKNGEWGKHENNLFVQFVGKYAPQIFSPARFLLNPFITLIDVAITQGAMDPKIAKEISNEVLNDFNKRTDSNVKTIDEAIEKLRIILNGDGKDFKGFTKSLEFAKAVLNEEGDYRSWRALGEAPDSELRTAIKNKTAGAQWETLVSKTTAATAGKRRGDIDGIRTAVNDWNNSLAGGAKLNASEIDALVESLYYFGFPDDVAITKLKDTVVPKFENGVQKYNNLIKSIDAGLIRGFGKLMKSAIKPIKPLINKAGASMLDAYERRQLKAYVDFMNKIEFYLGPRDPRRKNVLRGPTRAGGTADVGIDSDFKKKMDDLRAKYTGTTSKNVLDGIESWVRSRVTPESLRSQYIASYGDPKKVRGRMLGRSKWKPEKLPSGWLKDLLQGMKALQESLLLEKESSNYDKLEKELTPILEKIANEYGQKEQELDTELEEAANELVTTIKDLYEKIISNSKEQLMADMEEARAEIDQIEGGGGQSIPDSPQTPASPEDLQEKKYVVSRQKLINVIAEHMQDQFALIQVHKDQLIDLVIEEAFKQISRKK